MRFTKENLIANAKDDLAKRLKLKSTDIKELGISDAEFPDMSLGAPEGDEMSAQLISSGWRIKLGAAGKTYEYRADKYQLRLHNFNGANYVID